MFVSLTSDGALPCRGLSVAGVRLLVLDEADRLLDDVMTPQTL
jgi:superfamily II DNA/RNA helicase